jgi:hypothetical protein
MACQGLIETEIGTVGGILIKYFSKQTVLGFAWTWIQSWGEAWDWRPRGFWVGLLNHGGLCFLQCKAGDPLGPQVPLHSPKRTPSLQALFRISYIWETHSVTPHKLPSCAIYLKYSSYKLHPTISISQHFLRIFPHPESFSEIIWGETMTLWAWNLTTHHASLSFVKTWSTLSQKHWNNHSKLRGVERQVRENGLSH